MFALAESTASSAMYHFELRWQVQDSNLGRLTPMDLQSVHLDVCQWRHRWPSWNSAVTRLTVLGGQAVDDSAEDGLRMTRWCPHG